MTDHLEQAAARAIELAGFLVDDPSIGDRFIAAAHLTYLAGLLRGGAVRPVATETTADHLANECEKYAKRWHQAVDQRDALVRAAREVLDHPELQYSELDALRIVVERVEAEDLPVSAKSATLRRELWHVLDRMPSSDDDLVATVKKLKADLSDAGELLAEARSRGDL